MCRYVYILFPFVLALGACSSDEPSYPAYSGIASVELTDSIWALHFYNYTFQMPLSQLSEPLSDSSRVSFKVRPVECVVNSDSAIVYRSDIVNLSSDLRRDILFVKSDETSSLACGSSVCVPTDMHITRDFRHNDFFNVTVYYFTKDGNDDNMGFVYNPSDQIGRADSVVVLWLRHSQLYSDSLDRVEYDTFSVPLNGLIPSSDSERLRIKVMRLGLENDTVVEDYIYSFRNDI